MGVVIACPEAVCLGGTCSAKPPKLMPEVALQEYLQEIERLIDDSHSGEAIGHCQQILRQFPRHIETYRLLGKALLEQGELQGGSNALQRVLSADPEDFVAHAGLAIAHKEGNRLVDAAWHMERAFEVEPHNGAIREALQDLVGRRDGLPPDDLILTRGALARLYVRGELYTQAIGALQELIDEMPERMDLRVLLAEALWRDGQRIDAAEACTHILERLPYCIKANAILAEVWLVTDRVEEAQPYLRRVFELVLPTRTSLIEDSIIGNAFGAEGSPVLPDTILVERATDVLGVGHADAASDWVQDIGFGEEFALEDVEPEWLGDMERDPDSAEIELEERAEEGDSVAQAHVDADAPGEDDGATSWFSRSSDQLPGIGEIRQETDWEAWLEHGAEPAAELAEEFREVSSDFELEEAGMAGMDEKNQDQDEFPEMDESNAGDSLASGEDDRDIDWLDELQEASQPSSPEEVDKEGEGDLPDWLRSGIDIEGAGPADLNWLDDGEDDSVPEPGGGEAAGDDLPDWLRDEMTAEDDVTEPAFEEDLSWLDQIAAGEGPPLDEPPTMSWPESETSQERDMDEGDDIWEESDVSGESAMLQSASSEPDETGSIEAPQMNSVDENDMAPGLTSDDAVEGDEVSRDDVPEDLDEAMAWLEQLAAQQGASVDELPSLATADEGDVEAAPDDIESAMDWLDELAHVQKKEGYEPLAIGEEASAEDDDAEAEEIDMLDSMAAADAASVESEAREIEFESGIGRTEQAETADIDEAMVWLEQLSSAGVAYEELASLDDLDEQPDTEVLADLEDIPDDPEQAIAWLEGLASGDATETAGDDDIEIVEEEKTPPVPFDVVAARAEAESILLHDDIAGEDIAQDVEMLEEIPDDPDEAMAWLEKLAARQGASVDELPSLSEIEGDVETPDWLAHELEAARDEEAEGEILDDVIEDIGDEVDLGRDESQIDDGMVEEPSTVADMPDEEPDRVGPPDDLEVDAEDLAFEDKTMFDDLVSDMELEGIEEEGMLPDWLAGEGEDELAGLDEFDWEEEPFDATGWLQSEEQALQVGEEVGLEEEVAAPKGVQAAEEAPERSLTDEDIVMQEEVSQELEVEAEPVVSEEELYEPQVESAAEMEAELAVEVEEEPATEEEPAKAEDLADVDKPVAEGEPVIAEERAVAGEAEALQAYQERLASGEDVSSLIADLEEAAHTYESEPRFLQLLGDAYNKNGQLQKALDAYRRALDRL